SHHFCQRINIHPSAKCRIVVSCPKIINIYIKLILIFLTAKFIPVCILRIPGDLYQIDIRSVLVKTNGEMLLVISLMLQSPSTGLRAGAGIIMILFKDLSFSGLGMCGITYTDVPETCTERRRSMVGIVKNIGIKTCYTRSIYLDISFLMREELQVSICVLETFTVGCSDGIIVRSGFFKLRSICRIGIFYICSALKLDVYRKI